METAVQEKQERRPRRRSARRQSGSVFPRGNGWTVVFRNPNNKQKWLGGFATKGEAQKRLTAELEKIGSGTYREVGSVQFSEFCETCLSLWKTRIKPSTWCTWKSAIKKWLVPHFGGYDVQDISKANVEDFLSSLLQHQKIALNTVKHIRSLLYRIFDQAISREVARVNPAQNVMKMPKSRQKVVVPTIDEAEKVFDQLPAMYRLLLATDSLTGLRRGELLGLKWTDIDQKDSVIHVRRTIQRVNKSLLNEGSFRMVIEERIGNTGLAVLRPKTEESERPVKMPKILASLLSSWRLTDGSRQAGFIFHDEVGRPLSPERVRDVLQEAQEKAEVRHFGLHGFRHLYSSLIVESGAPVTVAQEMMRHADASTTLEIYTHKVRKEANSYAEKIAKNFPFVSTALAKQAVRRLAT